MSPDSVLTPASADTRESDVAASLYRRQRMAHWNERARVDPSRAASYYHRRLRTVFGHLVPAQARVLELGCGTGELLAALAPAYGVGIDFSSRRIAQASSRHPQLRFIVADAHALPLAGEFDVVILSDLINDLWDVQRVLEEVRRVCTPRTRIIFNFYSRVWELPLRAASAVGLARASLQQNWLGVEDVENLFRLTGFEPIRQFREFLWPVSAPGISAFLNRYVARLWPFDRLALTNVLIARPGGTAAPRPASVSVIVPARNEAGNIPAILARVPEMGSGTEIIFVEGHSSDQTYEAIAAALAAEPERRACLMRQSGRGKGDAVRLGFSRATGDILMILDADLTVPPEDLPRFYDAVVSGRGEFINGVRLVYPMEGDAMRFANLLGNKFFSLAFSWLLGQPIKDTLCGTKVLRRSDYEQLARGRAFFGDFDPFGDFDLIFGAARMNLRLVDLPVRYRARTYGSTNIQRWQHGWLLLRMLRFAAARLKFV
jgi:SAM-dependent methyltransferase